MFEKTDVDWYNSSSKLGVKEKTHTVRQGLTCLIESYDLDLQQMFLECKIRSSETVDVTTRFR